MWTDLDKKNRCEYGDDGFTLDMQGISYLLVYEALSY
jgi:hypothetical protein